MTMLKVKTYVAIVTFCVTALIICFVSMQWRTKLSILISPRILSPSIQHIICLADKGRLGNKMFQYASAYGIARSKGMNLVVYDGFELLNIFKLNVKVVRKDSGACDTTDIKTRIEKHCCRFDINLVNFNNTASTKLMKFLQSYLYFDNYSDEIRQQFTFNEKVLKTSNNLRDNFFSTSNITSRNNVTLIGVHVRRGDHVYNTVGYKVATKDYLVRAVRWFQSRYINSHFVVASNGMGWTKSNMPKHISVSYLEGNSPAVDMATLSSCDHIISTVGSYSWWSAWLNGGNVTYYKWPMEEGSKLRSEFGKNYSDFFYPQWVGL